MGITCTNLISPIPEGSHKVSAISKISAKHMSPGSMQEKQVRVGYNLAVMLFI